MLPHFNKGEKMRSSQESLDWYTKINDLWQANNFPIRFRSRQEITEKVDFNIAKQVWRKAFRQEYPKFKGKLDFVKELSGNRYTTYENDFKSIRVWINTSKGCLRPPCTMSLMVI